MLNRIGELCRRHISWLVFFGFTAFTVWFTWPLFDHLNSSYYGGPGDASGGIATVREYVEHRVNPFVAGNLMDFGAPEGTPISWPVNVASFSGFLPTWITARLIGAVAALNLIAITGHVFTAQATFLLARKLTGRVGPAIIAGWAFAFFPFMVINARGHAAFIHGWVLVLLLWRMLELRDDPSRRNGILAGLATVVAIAWNPYFLLFGGVLYATLFAAELVVGLVDKRLRQSAAALAWSLLPIFIFFAVVALATTTAEVSGARQHPISELTVYAARGYEYVVPHESSILFGGLTKSWISSHLHGSNWSEATLYLGISVLLLALIGFIVAVSGRFKVQWSRRTALALLAVSAVAFVFSAPPMVTLPVTGWTVKTPAYFVFQFSPSWRVYSRFVIVVMLGVSLLSAYGIAWLTDRRSRVNSLLILVLIGGVVMVDLWQGKSEVWVTRIVANPIYKTLSKQPPGILAEYPMEPFGYGDYSAEFGQNEHDHPILNGWAENSPEGWRAATLAKLSDPTTAPRLATLGVRYVYLEHLPPRDGVPQPGRPGAGFEKITGNGTASLYRVVAKPAPSVIIGAEGFFAPEAVDPPAQWLGSSEGTLDVWAACGVCTGNLLFQASSFQVGRTLQVMQNGKVVTTAPIGRGKTRVSAPIKISGNHADVILRVSPGPQQISKYVASPDTRAVSVNVRQPRFIADSNHAR